MMVTKFTRNVWGSGVGVVADRTAEDSLEICDRMPDFCRRVFACLNFELFGIARVFGKLGWKFGAAVCPWKPNEFESVDAACDEIFRSQN